MEEVPLDRGKGTKIRRQLIGCFFDPLGQKEEG